jgi:hypothetical protein
LDLDRELDPDPDPIVRGADPGIRIRINMSRIPNTAFRDPFELLDPDPDPHFECGSRSGSRRAKLTHKYRKKLRIFMF